MPYKNATNITKKTKVAVVEWVKSTELWWVASGRTHPNEGRLIHATTTPSPDRMGPVMGALGELEGPWRRHEGPRAMATVATFVGPIGDHSRSPEASRNECPMCDNAGTEPCGCNRWRSSVAVLDVELVWSKSCTANEKKRILIYLL